MGVNYFLLLSSLGLAITTQAQDCSKPVGGDNMNLKGDDILLQTFPDGTQVSFACDVGYVSAGGSPVITCTAGSWSPLRLKCDRRNCGSAGEVENGHIDYPEGTQFGDALMVTCNTGYRLVGKNQILCGAQGWMDRLPECEVVSCDPPPPVVDGTFSPMKDSYVFREVVQYSCQKDYALSGSKSLSCSDNGRFEPAPPTCTMVQCEDFDIENADWIEGSRPPHKYMSTVTYKCRSGYTMIGARTQTCGIDGQWSPGLPICQKLPATTKATTTTTTRPFSTKKPSAHTTANTTPLSETFPPGPTVPSGNNGNSLSVGLGIGLTVLILALTICGCYFCGVPGIIKKKQGSRRGFPDNVAPKDGEDVALS